MSFGLGDILSWGGAIAGIFSSGWLGIAGLAVGVIGLFAGAAWFIGKANKERDAKDLEQGGADVGVGAVDLRNQANANRDYMAEQRAEIEKEGAPK